MRAATLVPLRARFAAVVALAACVAGCAEQGPTGPALASKMADIQMALALVGDGQRRYEAERTPRTGYQYCSLSVQASHRGELRRAVELATMALYLGRKNQDHALLSQAARDLSLALGFAGKLEASSAFARMALDEALYLPFSNREAPYTKLVAWRVLGENLSRQGRYEEALAAFAEARRFQTSQPARFRGFSGDSLTLAVANTHLRAGHSAAARTVLAGLARGHGTSAVITAQAHRGLGDLFLAEGRPREALAEYDESLRAARAADNLYERVWALERLGRAAWRAGDRAAGIRHLTAAADGSEQLRAHFRSEEFRSGFFGSQLVIYDELMLALIDEGQIAAAFAVSERGRARALRDLMGDRVQVLDEPTGRAMQELDEARRQLGAARLDAVYSGADPQRRAAELDARVRDIEAQLTGRTAAVDFVVAAVGRSITAPEVQRELRPGAVLLEYHVLDTETLVWRIDARRVTLRRLPLPRAALQAHVEELRTKIVALAPEARYLAGILYTDLVAPALTPEDTALVVVPHDVLHYLPFAALRDGTHWLVERGPINILPSASVLLVPRPEGLGADARLAAIGNPTTDAQFGLRPLPGAEREVQEIARIFPGTTAATGRDATRKKFLALASASQGLHVAAHALYDDLDPLASAIFLAHADWDPGRLEAHEIFGLNLRTNRLATLSACQTGLGRLARGDEVIGLSRAFLAAGVRSLSLSLWSVDDESTGELMAAFYRQLRSAPAPEALRRAQLAVLKDHPEPFFWAPFFIIDLAR